MNSLKKKCILAMMSVGTLLISGVVRGGPEPSIDESQLLSYYGGQVLAKAAGKNEWQWHPMAVGTGGNNLGLTFSPFDPERIYLRIDVAGVIQTTDGGQHWRNTNTGLHGLADGHYGIGAIAIHPANKNVVYASIGRTWNEPAGIVRSEDGGESWQWWSGDISIDGEGQTARKCGGPGILIHPNTPDVMYALDTHGKGGVWQSGDAGKSWKQIGFNGKQGTTLRFAPGNPGVIYASFKKTKDQAGGIFFSKDAGKTWQESDLQGDVFNFVFDSGDANVMYAVTGDTGLYRSKDAGVTWVAINNGLPLAAKGHKDRFYPAHYTAIDADPAKSGHLITACYMMSGIYESMDGGDSWQHRKPEKMTASEGWLLPLNHIAWHTNQVYFHPRDSKRWYLCDFFGTWQSQDAGKTWDIRPYGIETCCMVGVHPDVEIPNRLYMGIWDHNILIYLNDAEKPRTLRAKNIIHGGVPGTNTHVSGIAQDARNPDRIMAVSNSAILSISEDRGITWEKTNAGLPQDTVFRLGAPAIASQAGKWCLPMNGDEQNGGGVHVSSDFGKTWRRTGNAGLGKIDVTGRWDPRQNVFDVTPDGSLMALVSGGIVHTSTDGGENWKQTSLPAKAETVALIRQSTGQLLAGCRDGGGLWRSDDGGQTWKQIWQGKGTVKLLASDAKRTGRMMFYVAAVDASRRVAYQLMLSEDDGATWTPLMNDSLAIWKLQGLSFDPFDADKIYVASYWGGSWVANRPK